MKKLLHERLRDWVHESEQTGHLPTVLAHHDLEFNNGSLRDRQSKLFKFFADEIERDYITRENCSKCFLAEEPLTEQEYGEAYDKGYEAGVKRGGEISLSALNEVELRENPVYQKGFEAGKTEALKIDKMPGDVLIEDTPLYQAGYETAAKDPTAWYILDKKGNQLHIGDTVIWDWSSEPFECTGFYAIGDDFRVLRGWDGYDPDEIQKCEKVTSDPWEDLENELAARLYEIEDLPAPFDIARQFIDRAKKLAGVD